MLRFPHKPTCSTCVHWKHIEGGDAVDDEGECHESGPTLVTNQWGAVVVPHEAAWPPVPGWEGCGKHPAFLAWMAERAALAAS